MKNENPLAPYLFQEEEVLRALPKTSFAYFHDMGVGKTCIMINVLRRLYQKHNNIFKTLIVCPSSVLLNWKREFYKFSKLDTDMIGVVATRSNTWQSKNKIINDEKNKILIITYDSLRSKNILPEIIKFSPQAVILDESHRIKDSRTKSYKAVIEASRSSRYRYIMSGTPVANTVCDLFSQMYFLDRGATFGKSFAAFRNRYMRNLNDGWTSEKAFPKWVTRSSLIPEIKQKLSKVSSRLTKEECIELPDFQDITIPIPLSTEQEKHYESVRKHLVTWVEAQPDNPMIVRNALVKLLRLNEISSGFLSLEDGELTKMKKNPRLDACMELVEDLTTDKKSLEGETSFEKCIIFSVFIQNYKDLKLELEKRGIEYGEIHGGVSQQERDNYVDRFQDPEDKLKVIIANPRSVIGMNLTRAKYSIFYSRNFNLIDWDQARDRNYRGGSSEMHDKITHYHLVAPETIDEQIQEALINKRKFAQSLIELKEKLCA